MDSREQKGKKDHILATFEMHGIPYIRNKLYVGDWTLLNDQSICIDTKTCGLTEVYSNLVQGHERFRNECKRAQEAGIKLIVLIEENKIKALEDVPNWVNPRKIIYQRQSEQGNPAQKAPPISSKRLHGIMRTMSELYDVEWQFTTRERCGMRILEILGVDANA